MVADILKAFRRVISRLMGREGRIKDKLDDVPSSFVVSVAQLRQKDEGKFKSMMKEEGYDGDKPDAGANVSELVEFVNDLQTKGRNRNKIKSKGAKARKTTARGRKAVLKR